MENQEAKPGKCGVLEGGRENISRNTWSTVQMPLKDPIDLLTNSLLMF